MELEVSSMMPTRRGRLVCCVKRSTARGGRPSSRRPKFSRLRPVMNLPLLSVTVKMRLTSLTWTWMVVMGWSDEGLADWVWPDGLAGACGSAVDGDGPRLGGGAGCGAGVV